MRDEIPAARRIAVVVEPGAEDEIRCRDQKDANLKGGSACILGIEKRNAEKRKRSASRT